MCGIAGLWRPAGGAGQGELEAEVGAMTDTLAHRGPDDHGVWTDPAAGLALGHRRLAIIDVSRDGHQPMTSACGRWHIVYNGEVYNFEELRAELESLGARFKGRSDTEVILAAVAQWGVEPAVARFVGMFAIALWDARDRRLYLVRDRLGIKPLYFGWSGPALVFASELKAICAVAGFERRIDTTVLARFFRHGHVPSPQCIYQGLSSLAPGTMLEVDEDGCRRRRVRQVTYWSAHQVALQALDRPLEMDEEEAADELERLLADAVRLRMIADVPLGAFLSGGIDSSAVVALMQAASSRKVRTFSIGFHEQGYDEAVFAKRVAEHLGTDHTELYLSDREAMEVIPRLPLIYDEPFADSSQIPTFLVSAMARRHVTVALTGDGGDELFGGYERYHVIGQDWRSMSRLPPAVRLAAARAIRAAARPASGWPLWPLVPWLWLRGRSLANLSERALRRARVLERVDLADFYAQHGSYAVNPELEPFLSLDEPPAGKLLRAGSELADPVQRMMYLDLLQYLPDDILTKVDRAAMAVALETRVPVLDHRVVELAWRLPMTVKVAGGVGKRVLRRVLHRHVPQQLVERPKMGFGIPFGEWIRAPLRDWAEELLSRRALESAGIFRVDAVRRSWREHVEERFDHRNLFWPILMFQAWRSHWKAS